METLTVEIGKELFEMLISNFDIKANEHYTIKKVEIKDDFFKDDATHNHMKKVADKAYRDLKEYEFRKRNK